MTGILVLILTGVLMYLYHKFFTVIYVNALAGILREIVVCFVLAVIILGTIYKLLGIELNSSGSEVVKPSAEQVEVYHTKAEVNVYGNDVYYAVSSGE